ncbi:4-hydroxy-tetrahydrodipicolinate synthase [Niabella drilacis]|uniref:4-hydroxy-tetrahydrodipicolinate synthase n=2 Tax=Niabella drilacis (strain DSM 25811 / CCM 8410 / CCUG 62505 / LMG 26954 / E90) TaxID=1285928 RepID=A0A1G6R824_NIADE|nr:4-hydroxy-tetrahydrodipicolinate synthase [Niabella drilacis]
MLFQWKGVMPAITTKFTSDGELDLGLFQENLEAQLQAGVTGVILGGTLGEASVLTTGEKERLVKFTIEKVDGRIPVILNVAEGSTRLALEQAALAAAWGADGLMLLPPMRYVPDHRELVTYFKTVADSTALPVMIYNNPNDYKTLVTLDAFEALTACPNITAIKESTRDVSNVTRLRNRFGDRYSILGGVDTLTLEALVAGADGLVAGLVCAFPAETVALYELVKTGRIAEALEIYRWFMPLLELDIHVKLVQYIKLAEQQTGIGSEYVRAPRLTLVGEEREQILNIINRGIATRPDVSHIIGGRKGGAFPV